MEARCNQVYTLSIPAAAIGKRIDKFIAEQFRNISRTQIKKSFEENLVTCNANVVPAKYVIRGGEVIAFRLLFPESTSISPRKMPLNILFEDSDIIAIDKPSGLVVHAGNGVASPTLVEGILAHCPLSALGGPLRPGVVHRIDKETSGVIIFAKSDEAYLKLIKMFSARKIEKFYQAIVCGTFTKLCGEIDSKIGRHRTMRTKMTVTSDGRDAITRWHLIDNFNKKFAHVRVQILTGRTHQIRVHMSSMGHSIVGDTTYGYKKNYSQVILPCRVMLHAHMIKFFHPCTQKKIVITSPLPSDFVDMLTSLAMLQ